MEKVVRFWEEVAAVCNSKPDWHLANRILYQNCSFALRVFHEGKGCPVLIVPPNAGHHSSIAERLIETSIATAPESSVYCMDWLPAKACESDGNKLNPECDSRLDSITSLHNYVALSADIIGKPVNLIGLCQGGWLATIYTALHPDRVKSLVLAAAPIDFHAAKDESKLQIWLDTLPQSWFEWMVYANNGVQPGEMQLLGFKNMNPYDRYIGDYVELWDAIDEGSEKEIQRWRRNHIWYDNPQNLGGKWFLESVDLLFRKNLLVKRQFEVAGEIVDLSKITCPVYMLIGDKDDITHPKELFSLGNYVKSTKIEKILIPDVGHIGVFLKSRAVEQWKKVISEICQGPCSEPAEELLEQLKL